MTGNTQLTLDTLLGRCGFLELVVSRLQIVMRLVQLGCCLLLVKGINNKEADNQNNSNNSGYLTLAHQLGLVLGQSGFVLLGIVDSGQFGCIVGSCTIDSYTQRVADKGTDSINRVLATCLEVGLVLLQIIGFEILDRELHAIFVYQLIESLETNGCIFPLFGLNQVLASIVDTLRTLTELGVSEVEISQIRLLRLP